MKIANLKLSLLALAIGTLPTATAWISTLSKTHTPKLTTQCSDYDTNRASLTATATTTALQASANDQTNQPNTSFFEDLRINPLYAIPYASFLAFGFYMTRVEAPGASQAILDQFLVDPVHPTGINAMFSLVFNLIPLVTIPLAGVIMPTAHYQTLPAAPFLLLSAGAGYGAVGPYVMTRRPVVNNGADTDADADADYHGDALPKQPVRPRGWWARNVWENRLVHGAVLALGASSFYTTGVVTALKTDFAGTVQGYVDLFHSTAIAGVSSVDFTILCLTAASLIPEDLARRGVTGSKAKAIAAATLLAPMLGAALYCALRPELVVDGGEEASLKCA